MVKISSVIEEVQVSISLTSFRISRKLGGQFKIKGTLQSVGGES